MAWSTLIVLQVLCWALFQVAQAQTLEEISEGLYEGDIVLKQEQKLLLQEHKDTNPALYWPKDSNGIVTVGYRFGDIALIKNLAPLSETITTPGTVSTPWYPSTLRYETKFIKVLVAPYCYKVKLTVVDFDLRIRHMNGTCAKAALIVRTKDALGTGVPYCGKEITPGTVFISGNNTIVLDYMNIDDTEYTRSYRGFNATVEHILVDGCTPTAPANMTPTGTTSTDTTSTATIPTPTDTTTTTTKPTTNKRTTKKRTTKKRTTKKRTTKKRTTTKPTTKTTTTKPTTTQPTAANPTTTIPTTTEETINPLAAPAVNIINSGDIPSSVSTSSSGLCILSNTSTSGSYKLTSPRYPSQYQAGDSCSVNLRTSEPSYLIVTATSILTAPDEIIYLNSVFGQATSITSEGTGQSYVLPSATTSLSFTPIAETLGNTFELGLQVQKSDCHQIIKVDAGTTGILTKVNYAANTICEWWIQAPTGMEIQLAFSTFNVGESGCAGDFLGIDTSGDPLYNSASQKYCATTSPMTVTSSGGQMNVLLKGVQGGYPGFIATYSVV